MIRRSIGGRSVRPVGLGCMNLSHAYGTPPDRVEGARLLHAALDAGYDFLDTAALYGFGGNETLIGETLAGRRGEYLLASKCGMAGVDGKRVIDDSGRMRSPFHTPSCKYRLAIRAQSRAGASS